MPSPETASERPTDFTPKGHEEVKLGNAVLGYLSPGKKRKGKAAIANEKWSLGRQRTSEMETYIEHVFGGPVSTDDAEFIVEPVAATVCWRLAHDWSRRDEYLSTAQLCRLIAEYLRVWFPTLSVSQIGEVSLRIAIDRSNLSADDVAKALGITFEMRQRLGLKTIGACDISKRTRKRRVKEAKAERDRKAKEEKRREAGAKPQSESLAALARKAGVSRMTVNRWRAKGILEQELQKLGCYGFGANNINAPISRAESVTSSNSDEARGDGSRGIKPQANVTQAHTQTIVTPARDTAHRPDGRAASPACTQVSASKSVTDEYREAVLRPVIIGLRKDPIKRLLQVTSDALRRSPYTSSINERPSLAAGSNKEVMRGPGNA